MTTYRYRETFTFDGKRYDVRANSKKELRQKITEKKRDLLERGSVVKKSLITVRAWTERYLDTYKVDQTTSTRQNRRWRIEKHILSQIGPMKLREVKPMHCQKVLNNMEGMGADTIKKVFLDMRAIFETAVQNDLIRSNPAEYITLPKGTTKTRREATAQERECLERAVNKSNRFIFFLFILYCGCRTAEVADIRWKDIYEREGFWYLDIHGTKTANAERTVPIPPRMREWIERLKEGNPGANSDGLLFLNKDGGKLSKMGRARLWKACKREMEILQGTKVYRNQLQPPYHVADDLEPYCLRHSYCCDLARQGIDPRVTQRLMGHANLKITMQVYTHIGDDMVKKAAEKLSQKEADQGPSQAQKPQK